MAQETEHLTNSYTGTGRLEDLPWFVKNLQNIKPEARELLENYSNLGPDDVIPHVEQVRDKAFKVFPYPCLGEWGFLDLSVRQSPQYGEVLERVKNGDRYIDLGCCVGQDIRKLVYDGAPSENTYGSDLQNEFIEIGYDLFLDRANLKSTFFPADTLNPNEELKAQYGNMSIVHVASFLHLFNWQEQVQAGKTIAALLKQEPGVMVIGRQIGNAEAGEQGRRSDWAKTRYRHNEESFVKMWKEIGEQTGTNWAVSAHLEEEDLSRKTNRGHNFVPPGTRWLRFTVRRQ